MTHTSLTVALLSALGASAAIAADELSAEQREIWNIVTACHDGWSQSMEHKDYELFSKSCPEEPGTVWWYTGGPAPLPYGGADGLWQRGAPQVKSASWSELEPVEVQIFGDVGLVYFSVVWTIEGVDGVVASNTTRRLSVLRRSEDGWRLVGGSVAGVQ